MVYHKFVFINIFILTICNLFFNQVRKDWYIYAVLSVLPWVGRELYEKKEQSLEALMNSIEVFLMKRHKNHHDALKVWYSDVPHPQEEVIQEQSILIKQ